VPRRTSAGGISPELVADRLHSAAIHLLRLLRRRDVLSGIGPAQLSALSVIVFAGPSTLGDLAAAEQVKPPTMSRIAAGLVRARLAQRVADKRDARVVRLHATSKGHRLLQEARVRRIAELSLRLKNQPAGDFALLLRATEIIEEIVRQ
jgi:DNA-binding MarR family transcriptional regulator